MTGSDVIAEQAAPDPIRRKSSFAGDVLTLVGGTTFAQALSVLAAPILTRLYGPQAFGTAAVFASMTTILSVVACLRYEFAVMLPERDEEAANLLAVSLCSVLAITGLSAVLVLLARDSIVGLLNAPALAPYLWLLPLAVLANGGFLALNYWNSRTRHFGRLSIARGFQSVVTSVSQVGLGAFGHAHAGGLIGSSVFGSAVVTTVLGGQIWRDDHGPFLDNIRLRRMLHGVKRYRKFPLVDLWGALTNSVSWQLPALMLSASFSQTVVGYYALANRVINLPMVLVGGAIAQVFFQRVSELQGRREEVALAAEAVFRILAALALFPALLLAVVGPDLFALVFGENWSEAGIYAQILAPWMFFWFISSPLHVVFTVLERQEFGLIGHVVILASRVVSMAAGGILGNVYLALSLFAWSGIAIYGGLALWATTLAGARVRHLVSVLVRYAAFSLPSAAMLTLLKARFADSIWTVLLLSAAAAVTYYALLLRGDTELRGILAQLKR